ncbi:response regulator transcription factor [Neptuniibacter sp. CAU 1671]|uniref:response regulator transcription factor n=1 Tax=Neptuniibacter sp. CAU 1671 TaxID=3032593 RepID=UPI0023DCDBDF|nr:response regulator transcription factor [Neptuniibacter sp. CAU 1671]MDF2182070.1 response regulator transcription factor [Neptuniibacter sp. CAU 1671]
MDKKALIYVIEDETDLADLVCRSLQNFHFDTCHFETGGAVLPSLAQQRPALCIVDLNLPDMDGIELVKQLQSQNIGIIIVSGRDGVTDRVLGLELGADDYITKPFEPRELVARVQSVLRRLHSVEKEVTPKTHCARFASWCFYPSALSLLPEDGVEETLSRAEGDMLLALLQHPFQILSRDQLLGDNIVPYDRSIDVRMSRLRKKLAGTDGKPELIKTVYGAGYMLMCDVRWE